MNVSKLYSLPHPPLCKVTGNIVIAFCPLMDRALLLLLQFGIKIKFTLVKWQADKYMLSSWYFARVRRSVSIKVKHLYSGDV